MTAYENQVLSEAKEAAEPVDEWQSRPQCQCPDLSINHLAGLCRNRAIYKVLRRDAFSKAVELWVCSECYMPTDIHLVNPPGERE